MSYHKVSHVIFDMDGLLLDTETFYTTTTQRILDSFGKTYPWELKLTLMGVSHEHFCKRIVEVYDLPITWQEFSALQRQYITELLPSTTLLPGAERLIKHLHSHEIPICLATSSAENMVKIKTKKYLHVFDLFHHKVCGSSDAEVKFGKPAPDIFLIAASRFSNPPKPEDCLVFEDAPNGIKAARAANMQVVMVPDERVPEEMQKDATKVLKSLNDFIPEEFGLPPFN